MGRGEGRSKRKRQEGLQAFRVQQVTLAGALCPVRSRSSKPAHRGLECSPKDFIFSSGYHEEIGKNFKQRRT